MPLSRRSHGRIVTATLVGALYLLAGCNAILGLEEKEQEVANGSAGDGTDAPSANRDAADPLDGDDIDAATGHPDGGCRADGAAPDAATATFYASCVPHVTAASVLCNEYGTTGGLAVTADGLTIQKAACSNLKGTWSDAPCNRAGAVFGCRNVDDNGSACVNLSISWYYPPATLSLMDAGCPASLGTVVFP